jgi:hypothetical protein
MTGKKQRHKDPLRGAPEDLAGQIGLADAGGDVGEHGADDNEDGDGDGGPDAGPEADAAEGNEEAAGAAVEGEAELVRKDGADGDGEQQTRGPDEGDTEGELQGLGQQGLRHGLRVPPCALSRGMPAMERVARCAAEHETCASAAET